MEGFAEVARWATRALFVVLALVSVRIWQRRRTLPSRWVAVAFLLLVSVVVVGPILPEEGGVAGFLRRLLVLALLLFPYALYRFAAAFDRPGRLLGTVADGVTALLAVAVLLVPDLGGEERTAWFIAFALAFVGTWVFLFGVVAVQLYRGGQGQPTLARRRMRLLALGSLLLGAALVVSVAASLASDPGAEEDPDSAAAIVTQLLAAASAGVFLVGFAPPALLRTAWRQPEEQDLHRAALRLLAATTNEDVSAVLLPNLATVVGASGVAIHDDAGHIEAWGEPIDDPDHPTVIRMPLRSGEILVAASPYTPFFGAEEQQLLRRLGVLADLALDRVALVDQLRTANTSLLEANDELESFVYSASHDLKNPLIAVLGYLDVIRTDYADALDEQGHWYLERMAANSRFMEALIQDLLELSRVGRVEVEPARVPLRPLVEDLAADLARVEPGVTVNIGALPTLWMNRTRLRQLFSNLFENAVKYAGPEVTVSVWAESDPGAGVRVHVADDGVGIAPEYHEKVFGMFERLEPDDSKTAGTGIGLALCRKIVQTVGGDLELVPSEVGAHLVITLPAPAVLERPGGPSSERLLETQP